MRQPVVKSGTRTTIISLAIVGLGVILPLLVVTKSLELTVFVSAYCLVSLAFFAAFVREGSR